MHQKDTYSLRITSEDRKYTRQLRRQVGTEV